jgi:hypothetical protein
MDEDPKDPRPVFVDDLPSEWWQEARKRVEAEREIEELYTDLGSDGGP